VTADEAIELIRAEVTKATVKFPTWPTRVIDAGNVVSEEAGELAKAVLEATYEKHKSGPAEVEMEAIQTGAMAVRFLMSMGRYDYTPGEQHEQNDQPRRCSHCGYDMANALGKGHTHCAPPFKAQPHAFGERP